MQISELENLLSDLRNEFPERVDTAEITVTINTPNATRLRWQFSVSDLCVDRLNIWDEKSNG